MTIPNLNGATPAPEQPQAVQLPPECMPQPIPTAWNVQSAPNGQVALTLFDATGQRWLIIDHESAARLGEDILRQAGIARTGLVLP